jgi:hypothetical protein
MSSSRRRTRLDFAPGCADDVDGNLIAVERIYPGSTTTFAQAPIGVVEIDATLATVRVHPATDFEIGAMGPDLVRFERHELDRTTRTPGRLEIVRGEAWQLDLAVDSEPRRATEQCDVRF